MTAPTEFNAAGLSEEQLLAAASELGKRNKIRDSEEREARYKAQQAKRNDAFSAVAETLRRENPQMAELSNDDLWEIWAELDDFRDKWDR